MTKTCCVFTGIVAAAIVLSTFFWISVRPTHLPGPIIRRTDKDAQLGPGIEDGYQANPSIEASATETSPDSGAAIKRFGLVYVILWTTLLFFALLVSLADLLLNRWRSVRL
jgi:hypothetical protein